MDDSAAAATGTAGADAARARASADPSAHTAQGTAEARAASLRRAKRQALACLLVAAAVFVIASLAPRSFATDALRALAEAALVGGLADWFAVSALFRRIPLPLLGRHTAIVPRNKDRIADNLARFVDEKFLDPAALVALIRRHQPADRLADWLSLPANAQRLADAALRVFGGLLDAVDDARIQALIRDAVHAAIRQVDLAGSTASILRGLTRDGRHQALLDQMLRQFARVLGRPDARAFIASMIVQWLRREHPLKEKVLPTEWLGEHGAALIANAVNGVLAQVAEDDTHALRRRFDVVVVRLIKRLRTDPSAAAQAERIKQYLIDDATLNAYVGDVWRRLRTWLADDLARPESALRARAVAASSWLGDALRNDPALRASLTEQLERAVQHIAPEFAAFLTRHISDTVRGWDSMEIARQVELNIGRDLQYIRINGTLVGACIGLLLFALSSLPALLTHGAG